MTGHPNEKRKTPGRLMRRLCLQSLGALGVFFVIFSLCQSTAPQANPWRQAIAQCFTEDVDLAPVAALLSGRHSYDTTGAVAVQATALPYGAGIYETMAIPVSGTVVPQHGQEHRLVVATDLSEPVLAAYDGTVTDIATDDLGQITVTISHTNGFVTTYGGCSQCDVSLQEPVKKGQPIGLTDGAVVHTVSDGVVTAEQLQLTGNFYFTANYLGKAVNPIDLMDIQR